MAALNKLISIRALQKLINTNAHFKIEFDHCFTTSSNAYNILVKI